MKKTNKYNGMIYGMCIGVGVGTALGVVFNHTILTYCATSNRLCENL